MFKLVVLLLSNLALIDSANISQECLSLFLANDPTDCWSAPDYEPKAFGECKSDCKTGKCCYVECLTRTGYIVEKPEKEKFLKKYKDNNFKEKGTIEKELWMPVISKSYDYCESLFDKINGTGDCNVPLYLWPMINCIKQQNFLNCPKKLFKSSDHCEAVRKFVASQDTCGSKFGDIFVIDCLFFNLGEQRMRTCKKLFQENNPHKCTQIPSPMLPYEAAKDCDEKCKDDLDICCFNKCHINSTGVLIGDEIQKDKLVDSFKHIYSGENEKVFETWLPVVEKAFDVCNPLVSEVKTKCSCNISDKLGESIFCMKQEMLLNVPTVLMKNAAECKKVQSFVKNQTTCGTKYGDVFIIDHKYWTVENLLF